MSGSGTSVMLALLNVFRSIFPAQIFEKSLKKFDINSPLNI